MLFSEIIGLQDTKNALTNAVKNNHVAHAQLFLGNEGSANLAFALAYATYLHCEQPQAEDACGKCPSCLKMNKLIHPDLHFIFPTASTTKIAKPRSNDLLKEWREFALKTPYNNLTDWLGHIGADNKLPNISAEEARGVVSTLSLKSFESEYKILLMWLPEYLNIAAANALLKILEEPPQKTIFLLVAQQIDQLLITILSRLQMVKICDFNNLEVVEFLQEKHQIEPEKAQQIAHLANGNLRKALLLNDEIQDDNHLLFRDWMRLCYKKDYVLLIAQMEEFAKYSKEAQRNLLAYGLNMCREALVYQYAQEELIQTNNAGSEFVKGFANVIHYENAPFLYELLNNSLFHLERNANAKITFLDTSLKIAEAMRQ
jgi:DNA polymerase III subunit delta'